MRLDLGYDGGAYNGWGVQPGLPTVQGVLEAAIATILRLPVDTYRLIVAGRTDAGVTPGTRSPTSTCPGRSTAGPVPTSCSDGSMACCRMTSGSSRWPWPLRASTRGSPRCPASTSTAWLPRRPSRIRCGVTTHLSWERPLDLPRLMAASALLLGLHDFAAFCRRREGATTIRSLRTLDWASYDDGLLVATVVADAFCHSMVRSLIGALLAVGDGRKPVDFPASLLTAGQRAGEVTVAPAHGLTLIRVSYPEPAEYAARADVTRALR